MSRKKRIGYLIAAALAFFYGAYGVLKDELFMPSTGFSGFYYSGTGAWVVFGALICATISLATIALSTDENHERSLVNNFIVYGAGTIGILLLVYSVGFLSHMYQ